MAIFQYHGIACYSSTYTCPSTLMIGYGPQHHGTTQNATQQHSPRWPHVLTTPGTVFSFVHVLIYYLFRLRNSAGMLCKTFPLTSAFLFYLLCSPSILQWHTVDESPRSISRLPSVRCSSVWSSLAACFRLPSLLLSSLPQSLPPPSPPSLRYNTMAWSVLQNLPFRARLKQAPVEKRILALIQNKLKIGRTRTKHLKGDRTADVRARQQYLKDTFHGQPVLMKRVTSIDEFPATTFMTTVAVPRESHTKSQSHYSQKARGPPKRKRYHGQDHLVSNKTALVSSKGGNIDRKATTCSTTNTHLVTVTRPRVEICFAGRSNVGKSSIINSLLNARTGHDAKVSPKPGETNSIDFYRISRVRPRGQGATTRLDHDSHSGRLFSDPNMVVTASNDCPVFVDLPGYGFALAKGEAQVRSLTSQGQD